MKRRIPLVGVALMLTFGLAARLPVLAQDTGSDSDTSIDELFGGEDTVEATPSTQTQTVNPVEDAISLGKVRVGGSFSGTLGPTFMWLNPWNGGSSFFSPDSSSLSFRLKSTLYVDARPVEDFRVHASVKAAWPFSSTVLDTDSEEVSVPNLKVFELFSDFSVGDSVFFRFGKSTVKWGVGYFWSPADVINLEQIDLTDPTAQREGPINFQAMIPIKGTQNNVYLLAILDEDDIDFDTTALAARAEFLVGNYELGAGVYYRSDTAERAMATITGPIGNFDVFGEAMVSRGSAKSFVTSIDETSPYIHYSSLSDSRDKLFFSATAGLVYADSKNNFSAAGQYYYNGEGYSDVKRQELINEAKQAIYKLSMTGHSADSAAVLKGLATAIYGSGRHYAAVNLSKSELFTEDLSASVLAVANLSDFSGMARPSISWDVTDYFTLNLSAYFFWGDGEDEYYFLGGGGNSVSVSLGATVSGSF